MNENKEKLKKFTESVSEILYYYDLDHAPHPLQSGRTDRYRCNTYYDGRNDLCFLCLYAPYRHTA